MKGTYPNAFKQNGSLRSSSIAILLMAALILLVLFLFFPSITAAQSGGGVGGAGGGSGGSGGHQSIYGYGWVDYLRSGPGPSNGFRDGTSWAHVQSTCSASEKVRAFIVRNSSMQGKVYDYVGWNNPNYLFTPGHHVDNNRATAVSLTQAEADFYALPESIRQGYTYGVNVAWFCYGEASPVAGVCEFVNAPGTVNAGASFSATFTVRNGTPSTVFPANGVYRLGSQSPQDNHTWGTNRVMFPSSIGSGQARTFSRSFTAPVSGGSYAFSWRFLQEGVGWHGPSCTRMINVQAPTPPSCPLPNSNLALPDRTPSGGPPGSAIWGPHDHHKRQNRSRVISVNDISSGGSRISIPHSGGTNHQVTLNYTPFITNYPYDRNQASVSYVSYYDTDHYQPNYSQPVYRRDPIYGPVYMVEWPQGEFWPWRDIIGYVDVLIGYRPMLVGTSPGREASGTANSPVIQPCRHRTFSASVSSGHGFLVPDREDPTSASYSGGTVSVQFNVQPGPHNGTLRIASRVTLNYTVQRSSQGAGSRSLGSRSGSILVTGGNTIPSNGSASISDTFSVSVPGSLRAGDRVCWTLSITPQQGVINVDGNRVSSSGSISSPQACSARVYDQSYLKSFGGEVVSGGGFLSSNPCAPASGQGGIYTWSRGSTATNYEGSSASLTVSSLLTINHFYSASQRTTGPHPPKGLTFANAGSSPGNSQYGGGSGNNRCITDYYEDTRDPGIHAGSWPGSLPGGAGRVQYTTPSDLTLGSLTVPVGTQAAIYVDGDVYIDRNIVYASGAGSWSVSPYFVLIAKGDIYIGSNVTRLDGLYIAQEKTIYTCASDMRGRYTVSTVYDRCQNQLYVNGGLVASDVKFLRMRNSMRDSRPAEAPNFAASSGTSAAEVIVYGPEMFLAPSPLRRTDLPIEDASTNEQSAGAYDSIKALPPVL